LEKRRRRAMEPVTRRRIRRLRRRRRRVGRVASGWLEMMYSTVVGEGRRIWRCGLAVSMFDGRRTES
jgi:hypothetical protein